MSPTQAPPIRSGHSHSRAFGLAAILAALVLALLTPAGAAQAQQPAAATDTARADTLPGRHWYDSLKVTRPHYARKSPLEKLALSAFSAMAVPVAITVSAITILPPSINLLVEDGKLYPGVAISTGRGFGGDTTQIAWFPDVRLQFEIGEYFGRDRTTIARAGALHDFIFGSVHPRNYFYLAAAGGIGVATDFRNVAPYLEGWFGVANPDGIRFITLFPMHNYGLRVRAGYDLTASRTQFEVAIAATSTF